MRAPSRSWRVHRLGTPAEALRLDGVEARPPGPGEARVAVGAIGLNFPDLLVCAGHYQERPEPPFSPGFEAAGTVVEVGPGAPVAVGQQVTVVPELPDGAFQETLTAPGDQLYPVPASMPVTVAAVLHVAYQTAHVALHHRARLRAGDTLVVTGAAGGVGMAAVQLGRAAGARVVAVVTGAAKVAACLAWGADVVVDLEQGGLLGQLRAAVGPGGADVVVDNVGGGAFDDLRRVVAFEGRLVVVGFTAGGVGTVAANHVLLRNYSVVGLHLARYRREDPELLRRVHAELVGLWERGVIEPAIHRILPFEEAVDGLAMIARRQTIGRVVLVPPGG